LHGPYEYLSHRTGKKTQTIFLNKIKLPYAHKWVSNYKEILQMLYTLSEINYELLRYYYKELEKDETAGKRKRKRA